MGIGEHGRRRYGGNTHRKGLGLDADIIRLCLTGESALSFVAVALALAILLVGVLDADVLVHEILAVHIGNSVI